MKVVNLDLSAQQLRTGHVVIPTAFGWCIVVAPDGTVVSEHRSAKSALARAKRLNRAGDRLRQADLPHSTPEDAP